MALYETGSASDMDGFVDKLMDFAAVTNTTFTEDDRDLVNNEASLSVGSLSVQFEWDADTLGIHQATAFVSATPGGGTNDSGSGGITSTQRAMHLPSGESGPYTSYHFFTDSVASGTYIHAVLEYSSGLYRHLSFGNLSKIGDWTGGEYACGHNWISGTNSDNPLHDGHTFLFEAVTDSSSDMHGTLRCEGLPDQDASGKYGVIWGGSGATSGPSSAGSDGNANARVNIIGGFRDGPLMNAFGGLVTNPANGFVALVPVPLFYLNVTPNPDELTLLGYAPDMRYVNMTNLLPGSVYTVGSEKWRVFPFTRKQYLKSNTEESWNAGVAYRDYVS